MGGDQLHIGGERAAAFRELVGDLDPRKVLLVGIDVAKASWFVLGCDLHGSVVIDGTKVAADRAGLDQLGGLLDQARVRVDAQLVVVGVEAAGHYHQTLAAHLADRGDLLLRLVNRLRSQRSARPSSTGAVRPTGWTRPRSVTCWYAAKDRCSSSATTPRPHCDRCGTVARTSSTPGPACGCRFSPWSTACGQA